MELEGTQQGCVGPAWCLGERAGFRTILRRHPFAVSALDPFAFHLSFVIHVVVSPAGAWIWTLSGLFSVACYAKTCPHGLVDSYLLPVLIDLDYSASSL